jgi:hypothetical protein
MATATNTVLPPTQTLTSTAFRARNRGFPNHHDKAQQQPPPCDITPPRTVPNFGSNHSSHASAQEANGNGTQSLAIESGAIPRLRIGG